MSFPSKFSVLFLFFLVPCSGRILVDDHHHFEAREWNVISPQVEPCVTNFGSFGRSAKYDQRFSYTYELHLKDGDYLQDALFAPEKGRAGGNGPTPEGLRGVFRAIETAIADSLLESDVFDSVCNGGTVRGPFRAGGKRKLFRNNHRSMRAVGISSNPDDEVLEGLSCSAGGNQTDVGPCVVVDGGLIVFLDIYEDLDDTLAGILKTVMNDKQQLDDVHPYVDKVRYVDLSAEGISGSIEGEVGDDRKGASNSALSSSFYALIAAGAFVVVGTAILYRRRRRAAEHDGGDTSLGQSASHLQNSHELQ